MDSAPESPLYLAAKTHTQCAYQPDQSIIRLLCIRNIHDDGCVGCLRTIIRLIRDELPNVKIYSENEPQKGQLGADAVYKFDCKLTCVVVIGGDGTMLFTAGLFDEVESPPIFGIAKGTAPILYNFFWNKIECVELLTKMFAKHLKSGEFITETCERLEVKRVKNTDGKGICNKRVAMSELTVHRGKNNSCVRMEIFIDGVFLTSCIGDGIIFATPHGSLAYSLASNGPILSNDTNSITMVPVCPLSMSFRPICLPNTAVISIRIPEKSRALGTVTCDGYSLFELAKDETLEIRKSNKRISMISSLGETPSSTAWVNKLKNALNWGNEFAA